MKKFLVAIEGVDCSFKATQTKRLRSTMDNCYGLTLGPKVEYPVYGACSKFIRRYLNGDYAGAQPDLISSLYSNERAFDYHSRWRKNYEAGEFIVSDRYTGSNMIHQACRIKSDDELRVFCDEIMDYEWNALELPKPDITILLLMHPDLAAPIRAKQRLEQGNKNGMDHDILEEDKTHLMDAYNNAIRVANMYGWKIVKCFDKNDHGNLYIKDEYSIHFEILNEVMLAYNGEE